MLVYVLQCRMKEFKTLFVAMLCPNQYWVFDTIFNIQYEICTWSAPNSYSNVYYNEDFRYWIVRWFIIISFCNRLTIKMIVSEPSYWLLDNCGVVLLCCKLHGSQNWCRMLQIVYATNLLDIQMLQSANSICLLVFCLTLIVYKGLQKCQYICI